jgi:SAM-dependent methyltransferase
MLEWTGERFLPWRNDPALAYEHLHRYFYAAQFANGKCVLDLASGEGYGSNLLAHVARKVVGIDIAEEAVQHARERYHKDNLEFIAGSITKIPMAESNVFDLIVCFEAIEHIEDQSGLLAEIVRLLKSDGVVIVSTPNKPVYDEVIAEENDFHVKELAFDEFRSLIETPFKYVQYLGQRVFAESNLWPILPSGGVSQGARRISEFVIERGASEFIAIPPEKRSPMYHIAVASNSPLDRNLESSILVDNGNALLQEKDRAFHETLASLTSSQEGLRWLNERLQESNSTIQWLEGEVKSLRQEQAHQKEWYEKEVAHRDATIASHEEGLKWRAGQVESLDAERANLSSRLEATSNQYRIAMERLEAIHATLAWKVLLRMRHYRDRLLPCGTPQRRFVDRVLRALIGRP